MLLQEKKDTIIMYHSHSAGRPAEGIGHWPLNLKNIVFQKPRVH